MYDLSDKVAVVTGAASGIGRATALALGGAGAAVVCGDLSSDGAEATARGIGDAGGKAIASALDVSAQRDVDALVDRAVREFGRLDVMANIAGIMQESLVVDTTEADFDRVIGINLKGVLFGCQAAVRAMTEGGSIVNMSSGAIDTPAPNLGCYAMAKAAVAQLTRTLATEVGKHGIRVNAVAPGFVMTAMTARHFTDAAGNVDEAKREAVATGMGRMAPLRRVGQPEDIANAVVFLASDASSFMTGQILRPNGGVAMPW